jgi:hypothetical protein
LRVYRDLEDRRPAETMKCICVPRFASATPSKKRAPAPKRTSCSCIAIWASGSKGSARQTGFTDTARRIEGDQRLRTVSYDEVLRGKAIVGMPEMVADRLRGLREELGLAGILAEMNCGGLIPQER